MSHPQAPSRSTPVPGIVVRPFGEVSDFYQCEEVQARVWSREEAVPSNMTIALSHHGAIAIGAFVEATGQMIGLAFSFLAPAHAPGAVDGLSHHSHMAAVLPEYQGRGIGQALKTAQADILRGRGLNLMTWTYDPLLAKNANLNITRLGCVCRTFIPNCYGEMRDGLNAGLPSDRFEAEWWLDDTAGAWKRAPASERVLIPTDFQALKRDDFAAAQAAQLRFRAEIETAFAAGYLVTGFAYGPQHSVYLLTRI